MSKLRAVKPQEVAQPKPKILVYGKAGVGKTWCALDFPNVYYIDTEGSAALPHYKEKLIKSGGVYLGQEQGSLDFETIIGQVKALATERHEYKTLIIDSISKVYNHFISEEIERLGDKDSYGASKKKPVAAMRKLINWLTKIDMNVILIAHEKVEFGSNAKGERVEMGHTFDCWDKLDYELDLALRIVKAGKNRNALIGKSRLSGFETGEYFSWSYDEFANIYGQDAIERDTVALDLATPEQLEELKQLFKTKEIPPALESKWFAVAGVTGWEEMPTERAAGAIKYINENF